MKKMKKVIVLFLVICVISLTNGIAQSGENNQPKLIGFGLHVEQFKLNDLSDLPSAPVNKLVITINPTKNFRLEPEFGFKYGSEDKGKLKRTSIAFGLGAFGMVQRNKVNIYGGLRYEYGLISREEKGYSSSSSNNNISTNNYTRVIVGPALGGEYFFVDNFSIGGEISLLYTSLNKTIDPKPSGYEDNNSSYFSTNTGLFCRFYF